MTHELEVLVEARALVGEGPIWDDEKQVLYWVDILSSKLYVYDPASGENRGYDLGQHVGNGRAARLRRRHGRATRWFLRRSIWRAKR
ncbi:MAG: SMP-30/gluconolactonase/LRE family protein [Caldilineaceae bacterium]|nr:SMP-30/gluconolactonase/LRE family protein [Caldilineaceae bacterium]